MNNYGLIMHNDSNSIKAAFHLKYKIKNVHKCISRVIISYITEVF